MNDELQELRDQLRILRSQNDALTASLAAVERRLAATDEVEVSEPSVARRDLLRLLGGAVAGAGVAVAFGTDSAAAAPTDPLVEGTNVPDVPYLVNASLNAAAMQLSNTGSGGALTASSSGINPTAKLSVGTGGQPALKVDAQGTIDVLVVDGNTKLANTSAAALQAGAITTNGIFEDGVAIHGFSTQVGVSGVAQGTGVRGRGNVALDGIGGAGLVAGIGIGLRATGLRANALFPPAGPPPWTRGISSSPPPTDHEVGEFVVDSSGTWWISVKAGPGADCWRAIGSPESAGAYVAVTPQRLYDSRTADGALAAGRERTLAVPASLPEGVSAVHINVTVANTVGAGYLAAFPGGTTWPGTSTVNWSSAGQTLANAITVVLGARALTFRAGTNQTDYVIDLYGYHR